MSITLLNRRFFARLILLLGFLGSLLLPQFSLALLSERDALKQDLRQLEQRITELKLDNEIKLKNGKTHQKTVEALIEAAKDVEDDEAVSDEEFRKLIQDAQLVIVSPRLAADAAPVPEGEIFADLIPQLIKLAFKVAWVAIFVSFMMSGLYFILSLDSEERLQKAKTLILYSVIGFLIITLAFAIVKAITNIDFFAFV